MSRTIHILSNWSAAGGLKAAIQPNHEDVFATWDVLSCGPLPPLQSIEQWTHMRMQFWHSVDPDPRLASCPIGILSDTEALREADRIILWLGLGIPDQLLLVWMRQLLKLLDVSTPIDIVQFTRAGARQREIWNLGVLPPELTKLHPPAERLSIEAMDELDRCWHASTADDPQQLISFLGETVQQLPHLRSSLVHILDRYPDAKTGLGRWDFELLRQVKAQGSSTPRIIGYSMGGDELDADHVGDIYLFSRLRRLANVSQPNPLVKLTGNPYVMRECEAHLTQAGEAVLAGEANAVKLNGIDDWVLGVHLDSSQGRVWYRTPDGLVRESSQ